MIRRPRELWRIRCAHSGPKRHQPSVPLDEDLIFALEIKAEMLDQRITSPTGEQEEPKPDIGRAGINDLSTLNRAMGILLAEGHAYEYSRIELQRLIAGG